MYKNRLTKFLLQYFGSLRVAFHEVPALIGFIVFLIIINQVVTGTMVALSLITEPMYIPLSREEEDVETLYTDDFFMLHERGVDVLVIFLFLHLFRKLYLNIDYEQEYAWKSGALLFLLIQVVIFLGLVLCCTHLSDITLVIASNAFHTIFLFVGKVYWLIFPDQTLNSDAVIRLAYLHYILAFALLLLGTHHGIDMHYDWKAEVSFDGIKQELNWYDEVLANEMFRTIEAMLLVGLLCLFLYTEPEALHYELFMWGDVGMVMDVRFYGVAPHWYFRPYMSWLIACPYHFIGIIGLILFFIGFYFQPNLVSRTEIGEYSWIKSLWPSFFPWSEMYNKKTTYLYKTNSEVDYYFKINYCLFIISLWYIFSYLPYGRFFNRLGGNNASLLAFFIVFGYMSGLYLRRSGLYDLRKTLVF